MVTRAEDRDSLDPKPRPGGVSREGQQERGTGKAYTRASSVTAGRTKANLGRVAKAAEEPGSLTLAVDAAGPRLAAAS